jgi:hypothetical protein
MGSCSLFDRQSVSVLVGFVLMLILAVPAAGQRTPVLSGVVVDEADGVLPGARVTVRDHDGHVVQASTTNREGLFSVARLDPGVYTVVVELRSLPRPSIA